MGVMMNVIRVWSLLHISNALSPWILSQPRALKSFDSVSHPRDVHLNAFTDSSLPSSDANNIPLRVIPGAMVAAEDAYDCWYPAQVLAVENDHALVHYIGWEDEWNEWLPFARIAPLPPETAKTAATEEDLTPEAFERRRISRLKSNDLWQFENFSEAFCSEWQCSVERFENVAEKGLISVGSYTTSLSASRGDTIGDARPETEAELDKFHSARLAIVTNQRNAATSDSFQLKPYHFRGDRTGMETSDIEVGGTAANAQATTARLNDCNSITGERLRCDLWLRRSDALIMLCLAYSKSNSSDSDILHFDYAELARSPKEASSNLGIGIADPHPYLKASILVDNVFELRLPGRITCAFPRFLQPNTPNVFSLDWQFGSGRTQIDRVFERPDASLASFEVTDLLVRDD